MGQVGSCAVVVIAPNGLPFAVHSGLFARRGGMDGLVLAATLRVSLVFRCRGWVVLMSVVLEELTICVGDGCANRFPDEAGWDGRCPECMALWDDHAAGQHDPPVDGCLLCR